MSDIYLESDQGVDLLEPPIANARRCPLERIPPGVSWVTNVGRLELGLTGIDTSGLGLKIELQQ